MSRKGNCRDNAPTESFFGSLKNERVHGTRYATRAQAVADLFDYIEVFYNRSRRHSALGYQPPVQFLRDWITTQHERKIAAWCRRLGRRKTEGTSQLSDPQNKLPKKTGETSALEGRKGNGKE